jgi:hypothetical protein
VGKGAWNLADLALALLFMAGFFYYYYYYVAGVVDENRALSRAAALAFLVCGVVAIVMLARTIL